MTFFGLEPKFSLLPLFQVKIVPVPFIVMGSSRQPRSKVPGCILDRLKRDWLAAKAADNYYDLGTIIRICARHSEEVKSLKTLNKWVEYLEANIDIIPLKELSKILSDIKYARTAISKARLADPAGGPGKYLKGDLTTVLRRSAARTLNNPVVNRLKNNQLEIGDDTDTGYERRLDSLDAQ